MELFQGAKLDTDDWAAISVHLCTMYVLFISSSLTSASYQGGVVSISDILFGRPGRAFGLYYTLVSSFGVFIAYHQDRTPAILHVSGASSLLVLGLLLAEAVLLEQGIDLLCRPQVVVHLALLCLADGRELDLL